MLLPISTEVITGKLKSMTMINKQIILNKLDGLLNNLIIFTSTSKSKMYKIKKKYHHSIDL